MSATSTIKPEGTPESREHPLPWAREDLFPEKPTDAEYGYLWGKKLQPCTKEELIARCESKSVQMHAVRLVWHPGAPRLVPVSQVDFLFEPLKTKQVGAIKSHLGITIFNLSVWSLMSFSSSGHKRQNWYLFMLTVFGIIPLCQYWHALRETKRTRWEDQAPKMLEARFAVWVGSQKAHFSWALLSIIVLVAISQIVVGIDVSIVRGGLDKQAVWSGGWWRLLTAPFLHAGPLHLIFNALSLFYLGKVVEALTSRYHAALVFLLSALMGTAFSVVLLEETSVGASGGIMGYIGFLVVLGQRRQTVMPPNYAKSMALGILLTAGLGIVGVTFIDNAAHLGGLIGGMLAGFGLINSSSTRLPLPAGPGVRTAGILSALILLICAALTFYQLSRPH
ncbi:MAG: rhomboid family intramembrane serine protease [Verrucomicrobiota bacterium]